MNQKIGMWGSAVNVIAVIFFAVSMVFDFSFGSYFSSMFIAFSFVIMICSFVYFADKKFKLAGYISMLFAAIYAAVILLVYFTQLTTVRLNDLPAQASKILDFQKMGLMFNYDLLGYALMALATFFAGLTICGTMKTDKWLKSLLMVHGFFFLSCLIVPMLGVFKADGPAWIGVALLEFWCLYFCPIGILSYMHFSKCKDRT